MNFYTSTLIEDAKIESMFLELPHYENGFQKLNDVESPVPCWIPASSRTALIVTSTLSIAPFLANKQPPLQVLTGTPRSSAVISRLRIC